MGITQVGHTLHFSSFFTPLPPETNRPPKTANPATRKILRWRHNLVMTSWSRHFRLWHRHLLMTTRGRSGGIYLPPFLIFRLQCSQPAERRFFESRCRRRRQLSSQMWNPSLLQRGLDADEMPCLNHVTVPRTVIDSKRLVVIETVPAQLFANVPSLAFKSPWRLAWLLHRGVVMVAPEGGFFSQTENFLELISHWAPKTASSPGTLTLISGSDRENSRLFKSRWQYLSPNLTLKLCASAPSRFQFQFLPGRRSGAAKSAGRPAVTSQTRHVGLWHRHLLQVTFFSDFSSVLGSFAKAAQLWQNCRNLVWLDILQLVGILIESATIIWCGFSLWIAHHRQESGPDGTDADPSGDKPWSTNSINPPWKVLLDWLAYPDWNLKTP